MSEHIFHVCDDPAEYDACYVCSGGLVDCTVCGGAEGALPTECPGVRMTAEQIEGVYTGAINFVNGNWAVFYGFERFQ